MADTKITALTAISTVDPAVDVFPIVDVSDTTMAASGTTKKITSNQLLGAGGTATLASATITGAATVGSDLTLNGNENYVYLSSSYNVGNNSRVRFRAVGAGGGSGYGGDFRISTRASNNTWNTDVLTIDSSANCIWTDGAGGTRMTLNSTGLGVGISPQAKIHIANASMLIDTLSTQNKPSLLLGSAGANFGQIQNDGTGLWSLGYGATASALGTPVLSWNSSGNVGIGVTPSAWDAGWKSIDINAVSSYSGSATGTDVWHNARVTGAAAIYKTTAAASFYRQSAGVHYWFNAPSGTAGNAISFTQAMTLDASGNLLVGDTAQVAAEKLQVYQTVTNAWAVTMRSVNRGWLNRHSDANGGIAAYFEVGSGNTNVGSINTTSSGTSFVTTSDYRLKENVQPLVGGLARISALKPSIYKWKIDGSNGEGFLAHELAAVVPFAVTGEKDALNEDGSIKPQGVDLSKVVPVLVAAIQELTARVQTLETR